MIKKLILLLAILTLSWNSFSQNVTRDSTHIILSTEVARKVAMDLVEGDRAKELNISLQNIIADQKSLIETKNLTITDLEKKIESQQEILIIDNTIISTKDQELNQLKKDVKKNTAIAKGFAIGTSVIAVALLTVILIK